MKTRIIVAGALLTAGLAGATAPLLMARQGRMCGRGGEARAVERLEKLRRLGDDLDLTFEQKQALREVFHRAREANATSRAIVRDNLLAAGRLLLKNPGDMNAAESALGENDAAWKTVRSNLVRAVSEAVQVLTPEQRSQLESRLEALPDAL